MTTAKRTPPKKETVSTNWLDAATGKWQWLTVFLFSMFLYFNTLPNGYNIDDTLVTQNHRLTSKGISAIANIFKEPYYKDKAGFAYEYRPIVLVSFAIEHQFFGEKASGSHFFNVLFYGLLCVLLLSVLRQLLQEYSPLVPFIITLLFAAHPIHTEVVASIKNRDELLAVIFSLLAWKATLLFADTDKPKRWLWLPVAALSFLIALLSKQTATTFIIFIPASLLIFRNVRWYEVTALYLALAVVMFPVLNLPNISSRTIVIGGTYGVVTFIYLLIQKAYLLNFWSEQKKQVINVLMKPQIELQSNDEASRSKLYTQPAFYFTYFGLLIVSLAVFFAGMYYANTALLYAGIFILSALFVAVQTDAKPILFLGYATALLCAGMWCEISTAFLFVNVLATGTMLLATAKKPALYIVLFSLLLILTIGGWHSNFYWGIVVVLLFAALTFKNYKWTTYAGISFLSIGFAYVAWLVINGNPISNTLLYLLVPYVAALVYILIKNIHSKFAEYVSVAMVWVALLLSWNSVTFPSNAPKTNEALAKINWQNPVNITPKNLNRPVQFMETPVNRLSPMSEKIGTAADVLLRYLKLSVLPYPMRFYYGYKEIVPRQWTDGIAVLGLLVYGLLLAAGLWLITTEKKLAGFGLLFYTISIASYTNVVTVVPGVMADRFLFVPTLGTATALTALFFIVFKQDVSGKLSINNFSTIQKGIVAGLLVIYTGMTIARNTDWKNELTLYRNDIKHLENSAKGQDMLGVTLLLEAKKATDQTTRAKYAEEAIIHLKRSAEIVPDYKNPWFDMGQCYLMLGKPDEAFASYKKTIELDSNFVVPCLDMASILYEKKDFAGAIPLYEKYLSKFPQNQSVYANLSFSYFMLKDYDNAVSVNRRATQLFPYAFEPYINTAKIFLSQQKNDSALYYFRKTQLLLPNDLKLKQTIVELEKTLKR